MGHGGAGGDRGAILLALVQPWGRAAEPGAAPLAWLGSVVMTVAGAVGLTMSVGYLVGAWEMDRGDLYTITYVYVYGGFPLTRTRVRTTAWLTRLSPRIECVNVLEVRHPPATW